MVKTMAFLFFRLINIPPA